MSDSVKVVADVYIDKNATYKLKRSDALPIDILYTDILTLYFRAGALRKLQAAIDVYLGGQHTQDKEDWQDEAAGAESE